MTFLYMNINVFQPLLLLLLSLSPIPSYACPSPSSSPTSSLLLSYFGDPVISIFPLFPSSLLPPHFPRPHHLKEFWFQFCSPNLPRFLASPVPRPCTPRPQFLTEQGGLQGKGLLQTLQVLAGSGFCRARDTSASWQQLPCPHPESPLLPFAAITG